MLSQCASMKTSATIYVKSIKIALAQHSNNAQHIIVSFLFSVILFLLFFITMDLFFTMLVVMIFTFLGLKIELTLTFFC